jgi:hypothetical protein
MSFLRIGDTIINTNHITMIKISTDNYHINMLGNNKGFFTGNWLFSTGNLYTENNSILVSKSHYKEGYDAVTKWILDNKLGWN